MRAQSGPALEVLVCVSEGKLRQLLLSWLQKQRFEPIALGLAGLERYQMKPGSFLFLNTGEDAARLVQVVNDLHRRKVLTDAIVCLLPSGTLSRNPLLGFWSIDGHAAARAVCELGPDWQADLRPVFDGLQSHLDHFAERLARCVQ